MTNSDELRSMMSRFVSGADRSLALANEIELALNVQFDEREPFASVALALASYRPGGGEFLYDEIAMTRIMKPALEAL